MAGESIIASNYNFKTRMKDLEQSLNLNFSRLNSNGWQNFGLDSASQDVMTMRQHITNAPQLPWLTLLNEPPRPNVDIYTCIDSELEEQSEIKEVQYIPNEPEAKHVNPKQYFRMMKQRIKKVMHQLEHAQNVDLQGMPTESSKKRKYLYESRHQHALGRKRGKDGRFIATRSNEERFREKKKRGRKPKNQTETRVIPVKIEVQKSISTLE